MNAIWQGFGRAGLLRLRAARSELRAVGSVIRRLVFLQGHGSRRLPLADAACTALQIAFWLRLSVLCQAAESGDLGRISVTFEYNQPVFSWSNSIGQAYVIAKTTNLALPSWEPKATVTSDASSISWADDSARHGAAFYRVELSPHPIIFQQLQAALQRACATQRIVGASAAAVLPQDGLWLGSMGHSHGKLPIRPYTPFEFASVTKTFIAATILRLAEEGKLSLEDTIDRWLPNLQSPNIPAAITIRQLLNHRAGTYNFGDDTEFRTALFSNWSRSWEPEQVLAYVKAPPFEPGASGAYSNTGYVLLGMIIRAATGQTAAEALRRTILDRAGLRSTWLGSEEAWTRELAHPHLDFDGDGIHEDIGNRSQKAILSSFGTSGALISTAADVATFGLDLFEEGLLDKNSLSEMKSFQPLEISGTYFAYGLGLMRFDILGSEHWAHSGGLFGEYGWFSYCPKTRVSLAVAYNHPNTREDSNLPGELLIVLSTLPEAQ